MTPPASDTKLWRYLELPALVYLLSTRQLHFTRPDKFTDKFEGSPSRVHWRQVGEMVTYNWSPYLKAVWEQDRLGMAINCWHMSDYESLAMWELYGRAVAVQTTFERLMKSLAPSQLTAGAVEYVDHAKDPDMTPNGYAPFFRKGKSYAHERELRLIISQTANDFVDYPGGISVRRGAVPDSGIDLPLDPVILVEAKRVRAPRR